MTWFSDFPTALVPVLVIVVGGAVGWVTNWISRFAKRDETLSEKAERITSSTLTRQENDISDLRARLGVVEKDVHGFREYIAMLVAVIHDLASLVRQARSLATPPTDGWPPIPTIPRRPPAQAPDHQ